MSSFNIGTKINLEKLVDSRLLVQANSGGGKSVIIRNILEETFGKLLFIVLDMEGEYFTLREKYDILLIGGKNGDVPVNLKAAPLLPKKILELKIPTVIDLSDLKMQERTQYVKKFLDSLMDVKRDLWQPCLVVVEEAHKFAGQQEKQDSTWSVIDLMTRGRKRGFCGALVTQRISKLHKDAAAEANNKFIGRTFLDIDMKRAAEELGFSSKSDMLSLRDLKPGEFYTFGVAIEPHYVHKTKINIPKTTHPKVGMEFKNKPVPPTKKIKELLTKLSELPQEAEKQRLEKKDLIKTISDLKQQLRRNEGPVNEKIILAKQKEVEKNLSVKYNKMIRELQNQTKSLLNKLKKISEISSESNKPIKIEEPREKIFAKPGGGRVPVLEEKPKETIISDNFEDIDKIPKGGALRMLEAIAAFYPNPITKPKIATIAGISYKSGTFRTYIATLMRQGNIKKEGNKYSITDQGLEIVGDVENIKTDFNSLISFWSKILKGGVGRMLIVLAENYPNPMTKEELGEAVNINSTTGTFRTYLATLKRNGLIKNQSGEIELTEELTEG